jgi:hypothetical protein
MDIKDNLDHQRWLIDNGLITDIHKDNLYIYGAICHPGIKAVELNINVDTKKLEYFLYIDLALEKTLNKFNTLKDSKSIWHLWLLKRLLKKHGNLNIPTLISKMVVSYLGPKWSTTSHFRPLAEYIAPEAEQK